MISTTTAPIAPRVCRRPKSRIAAQAAVVAVGSFAVAVWSIGWVWPCLPFHGAVGRCVRSGGHATRWMYVGSGVRALGDGHVYRFTGWLAGACAREDMRHAGCTSGPAFAVGPWSLSVRTGVASDALYLEASHRSLPVADARVEPGVHDVHGEVHEDE